MNLKDFYSQEFYNDLADNLSKNSSKFNRDQFLKEIYIPDFQDYELKERSNHTCKILHRFLSSDYREAISQIKAMIQNITSFEERHNRIVYLFFAEYISMFGLEELEISIEAMEFVTCFISCEFAVRPFIVKYPKKMYEQAELWAKSDNNHVRRLASEGYRPRLPWGMALQELKKNPKPILPILEELKNDSCEIVRRSVANNLNDIAKDNPKIVIEIAKKWLGDNSETDKLVKHACRTLLKQGEPDILKLFGYDSSTLKLNQFEVITPKVKDGDSVEFEFEIENHSSKATILRLEYAIHFLKANGSHYRKVFKISERQIEGSAKLTINKKHSFRPITTRKYYMGEHFVSIILNGKEFGKGKFILRSEG
jgi:3-methyladenine DNA glycosylase AlkC